MNNLNLFIRAKRLIKKAFVINRSIPKGYGTRSSDYQKWYIMKEELIRAAISLIEAHNLPIIYGQKNEVVYFEFENKQFSFHGNYTNTPFFGEWIGKANDIEVALHVRHTRLSPVLPGIKDCCKNYLL